MTYVAWEMTASLFSSRFFGHFRSRLETKLKDRNTSITFYTLFTPVESIGHLTFDSFTPGKNCLSFDHTDNIDLLNYILIDAL